jgi:hypothetical protein
MALGHSHGPSVALFVRPERREDVLWLPTQPGAWLKAAAGEADAGEAWSKHVFSGISCMVKNLKHVETCSTILQTNGPMMGNGFSNVATCCFFI